MKSTIFALVTAGMLAAAPPANANNLGENGAWQFRSPSELGAMAAALEVLEKKRSGGYAAPAFTTNIARQFNCGVSASALGNSGGQSASANSPSVSGANASAEGNAVDNLLGGAAGTGSSSSAQDNSGPVSSGVTGATDTAISGSPTLALNSTQSNSGAQTAGVTGSTACTFGVLN